MQPKIVLLLKIFASAKVAIGEFSHSDMCATCLRRPWPSRRW